MARTPPSKIVVLTLLALLMIFGLVAGAVAQGGETMVTIAGVESQDFPQVTIALAAVDTNGLVDGLTADNFQVFEDGSKLPITPIAVERDTLKSLRLVLALDVSIPNSDLTKIKAAATTLINTLGPRDRTAIITFGNEVALEYDFTNNTTELQDVIDNLAPRGDETALHKAVVEATAIINQLTAGARKAVVVITDSRNNTGDISVDEAVSPAEKADLPLYIIGFGNKVQASHPLKEQVALTSGQYFTLPQADEVQSTLQNIEALLRTGYKVTFLSTLKADDAEHNFAVAVTHSGGKGRAEGVFVAVPGVVHVTLPGIVQEQMVDDVISLTPQVTAPTAPTSVTYLLDNQLLAEVTEPPYGFEWDTATAKSGPHILSVKAVDGVGNQGQTEVSLIVVGPVKVAIIVPQGEIEVGDQVPIQAKIEATAEVISVDLLLDDKLLNSKAAVPYQFDFDTSQYSAGEYVFTIRVKDSLGQVAEDSLNLTLLPEPPPPPSWWERIINDQRVRTGVIIALALVPILIIVLVTIMALKRIAHILRQRSQRKCRLEIANLGNIQSRYGLRARDTGGDLKFQFAVGGSALSPLSATQTTPAATVPTGTTIASAPAPLSPQAQPLAAPTQPVAATVASPAPSSLPSGRQPKSGTRQAVGKAQEKQAKAYGCAYAIIEILDSVAFLLPGSAGASVRRMSAKISGGQAVVDRAVRTPTQMVRTADHLRGQVAEVAPSGSTAGAPPMAAGTPPMGAGAPPMGAGAPPMGAGAPPMGAGAPPMGAGRVDAAPVTSAGMYTQPAAGAGGPAPSVVETTVGSVSQPQAGHISRPSPNGHQTAMSGWSQTPFIEPGDTLMVDLVIMPTNPYRKQEYDFTVTSKAIGQEGAPLVDEHYVAQIKGVFWLWRYLLILAVILVAAMLVFGIVWLTAWRLTDVDILNLSVLSGLASSFSKIWGY